MPTRPRWDPRDPAVLRDQRRGYDAVRDDDRVAHSDLLGWSLFRHEDVTAAAADAATFSSATRRRAVPNGMDPPTHTVYRRLLEPYFSPARLAAFEPRVRALARDLLDRALARDSVDLVEDYAVPFAHQAVCAFVGWPVSDWNRVRGWTHGNQEAAYLQDREAGARLAREFTSYVTAILVGRRASSETGDDLMAELSRAVLDGRQLSDEDVVSLLRTWTAGHGTVVSAIGNVALALAGRAGLQDRLRREPGLVDVAVREALRADGPLVANNRTATRAVVVGDVTIEAGERVSLVWLAADRDPAAFPEPDDLRLDRDPEANLLFGSGIHRCLGEPLAMLEIRVAIGELLARTAPFELDATARIDRETYPSGGLARLPVRLDAATDASAG